MITLRQYNYCDAKKIVSWLTDERAFRLWCADRFKSYPLTAEVFDEMYSAGKEYNGMIALDGEEAIGHLFIQNLDKGTYKFGLIIVDSTKRGNGYGKKMLEKALEYAKTSLSAKRVILSAFDTNPAAYNCYKGLGFKETGNVKEFTFFNETHRYFELEYEI